MDSIDFHLIINECHSTLAASTNLLVTAYIYIYIDARCRSSNGEGFNLLLLLNRKVIKIYLVLSLMKIN